VVRVENVGCFADVCSTGTYYIRDFGWAGIGYSGAQVVYDTGGADMFAYAFPGCGNYQTPWFDKWRNRLANAANAAAASSKVVRGS
jgi:hypothetical protein